MENPIKKQILEIVNNYAKIAEENEKTYIRLNDSIQSRIWGSKRHQCLEIYKSINSLEDNTYKTSKYDADTISKEELLSIIDGKKSKKGKIKKNSIDIFSYYY